MKVLEEIKSLVYVVAILFLMALLWRLVMTDSDVEGDE